ncbi:MAG: helix-turn-helix domain-containing protein [Candidatus Omnitrophota bacterium]
MEEGNNLRYYLDDLLDSIGPKHKNLPSDQSAGSIYKQVIALIDKRIIERALEVSFGNKKRSAKLLGINRNTLYAKIKKLDINVNKYKEY